MKEHPKPGTVDAGLLRTFSLPSVERVRAFYHPLCVLARGHFAGCLTSRFVLVDGVARDGDALLVAASIAGAVCLIVELRPEAVRYCVRNGIVDFAVNRLDEALQLLKNELSRHQPLAVLLEVEPELAAEAMVQAGLLPDLLRWPMDGSGSALRARGALEAPAPGSPHGDGLTDVHWSADEGGGAALRQVDMVAAAVLPAADKERQNWIARAARYLPRALRVERCVAMSDGEAQAFVAAVAERAEQGALMKSVVVTAQGRTHYFG